MSSEVPTINLFDNDNSSGSFFESFASNSGDTSSLFPNSNHSSDPFHSSSQHSSDIFQSTNNNTSGLFQASNDHTPSDYNTNTNLFKSTTEHTPHVDTLFQSSESSQSLFAQSDSHSFFDALSSQHQPTPHEPAPHQVPAPTTTTPISSSTPPPVRHATPPPLTNTPPLPTTPPLSHATPPLSTTPPPSTPPHPTRHDVPTQVVTPAGVIDNADIEETKDDLFSSSTSDPVNSLFFENLSLSDTAVPPPGLVPPAPFPATSPHTPTPTPQSALNAPLPTSPMPPHYTPHSSLPPLPPLASQSTFSSPPPIPSHTPAHTSLPRRSSGSDLPSTYEHSLSQGLGPSPLGRNSSYNDALSHLDHTSSPLTPPLSRVHTPPPVASSPHTPPLSRVHTPPPAGTSSPLLSRPSTNLAPPVDDNGGSSPVIHGVAPSSPAPPTHMGEASPLLPHAPPSASTDPAPSTDEHEAPIPHFTSTDDDQNIFDSFLNHAQQPDSATFFSHTPTPPAATSDPTPTTTSSALSTSTDHTTPATSLDQSSSHPSSAAQSYDASQYAYYYNQQQYYGNYDYTNYPQYQSQDATNSGQYTSSHDTTNSNNQYSKDNAGQYSQDNANQYYQYPYNSYGQQSSYDQSGYGQSQHAYPSYPYSNQHTSSHDTTNANNQYSQGSANQYSQFPNQSYENQYSNHYSNPQSDYSHASNNTQYTSNNQQYPSAQANNQYSSSHDTTSSNHQYSTNYSSAHAQQFANANQYAANNAQSYATDQYSPYSAQQTSYTTPSSTLSSSNHQVPSASTNYSTFTPQQTGNTDTLLFDRPHPVVAFGFCGKMAIFQPSSSSFMTSHVVRVESVRTVLQRTPFLEPFMTYPGPLSSSTSKDSVSRWIGERIAQSTDDGTALLWGLLKIMSEHYGSLIKSPDASTNPETAIQKLLIDSNEHFDIPTMASPSPASLQEVQQLLLAGDRAEACRVAATTHQWSHALLLAQFCGPEVYASTIANFATTVLPEGSPLRTMYLLYGRQPQEIFRGTGASSALLDKWKANLAAILATNPSSGPPNAQAQPDRRVAAELGDRLWGVQGRVEAAHCCYLLADLPHGPVDNPNTRIVLLGADHKRKRATSASASAARGDFPSNFTVNAEAIMRSEIYEWSKILGNSQYVLPGIHPYKLAYAAFMADLGFPDVAVHYVQQLSASVRAHKGGGQIFTPHYLYQLDTFEERLRGTGAAKSLAASGSWFARGLSGLFGSKTKLTVPTARPESAKKNDAPKKGSGFKPREEPVAQTSSGLTKEEEEYAASFSTKKKEPKEGDKLTPSKEKEKDTKKGGDDEAQAQKGVLSRFAFWKKSGTEAKLGEDNAFEYNEELKMWVEKGKPLPEPERPPPPPPTTSYSPATPTHAHGAQGAPPLSAGGPPPTTPPGPGAPPPTTPPGPGAPPGAGGPNNFTSPMPAGGGRRKPRYFDSLNDQVYTSKSGGGSTPAATPDKGNVKIFTPFTPPTTFTPSPTSTPAPAPDTPPFSPQPLDDPAAPRSGTPPPSQF